MADDAEIRSDTAMKQCEDVEGVTVNMTSLPKPLSPAPKDGTG